MRDNLPDDLRACHGETQAVLAHQRGEPHDGSICVRCLRRDVERLELRVQDVHATGPCDDATKLARVVKALRGVGQIGQPAHERVQILIDRVASLERAHSVLQAHLAEPRPVVGVPVTTEHTFVGRVAQLPCIHGRRREDGPCAAYERTPSTSDADPTHDLLECPPCAARRLMADVERAVPKRGVCPACGSKTYTGEHVCPFKTKIAVRNVTPGPLTLATTITACLATRTAARRQ